ncbi:MAG: carbonic anhydrase [Bacteroidetes bacterium]|nr:carbonic anhydrase [Bacteroidota bacterium]
MYVNRKNNTVPEAITAKFALQLLKEGNFRFVNNLKKDHDLLQMVNETKDGQQPFAAVLSCMDSRTSSELVFDQGLGDIFSIRIAGNIVTQHILGSLEYATAVAGAKLVLVLGHTGCGAVKGACDNVHMGHLTTLLQRIQPAIQQEDTVTDNRTGSNTVFVNKVAEQHVKNTVQQITEQSTIIKEQVDKGDLAIVPAMYDVATGKVRFYE